MLAALTAMSLVAQPAPETMRVLIRTELGEIEAIVDGVHAPVSAANFLRYVDGGYYGGGRFYRTVREDNQPADAVKIAVVQAEANRQTLTEKKAFPPIPIERTRDTGLHHRDGTLSMARGGPDTATHSFFVCIGDQPGLDFGTLRNPDGQGFAAFGQVVRGMDVVRAIQQRPADQQTLTPAVGILGITRIQ